MIEFLKKLIRDDNEISEKTFVGLVSLVACLIILIADLITGLIGKTLNIHQYVFDGFLILCAASLGIGTLGQVIKRPAKKEEEKQDPDV
jgi:hypothetical protein